jgi:hypothetical protein
MVNDMEYIHVASEEEVEALNRYLNRDCSEYQIVLDINYKYVPAICGTFTSPEEPEVITITGIDLEYLIDDSHMNILLTYDQVSYILSIITLDVIDLREECIQDYKDERDNALISLHEWNKEANERDPF